MKRFFLAEFIILKYPFLFVVQYGQDQRKLFELQ